MGDICIRIDELSEDEDCASISDRITIVWRRENSDAFALVLDVESLVLYFVGADEQLELIRLQEPPRYVRTKKGSEPSTRSSTTIF